jgi:hypothetical protein
MAASTLKIKFSDQIIDHWGTELTIDVSSTASSVDHRRADSYVKFNEDNGFLGKGLIIEVQCLNNNKNIQQCTSDYFRTGWSVYWATPTDFNENYQLDWDRIKTEFKKGQSSGGHSDKAYTQLNNLDDIDVTILEYLFTEDHSNCDHNWEDRVVTEVTLSSLGFTPESPIDILHCTDCRSNSIIHNQKNITYFDLYDIISAVEPEQETCDRPTGHSWQSISDDQDECIFCNRLRVSVDTFRIDGDQIKVVLPRGYRQCIFDALINNPDLCDHMWTQIKRQCGPNYQRCFLCGLIRQIPR